MPKYTFKLTATETYQDELQVEADSLKQAEEMVKAKAEMLDPLHDDFDYVETAWEIEEISSRNTELDYYICGLLDLTIDELDLMPLEKVEKMREACSQTEPRLSIEEIYNG
jgi:hypothetical protein